MGNISVALAAASLLPLALYLLGRQLAPAYAALAGALIAGSLPLTVTFLGQVSDYLFCAWLLTLSAAAALWAARARHGASLAVAGVGLALYMAATPKAITWLAVAIPVLLLTAMVGLTRRPLATLLRCVALLSPLVLVWLVFQGSPLLYNSLEYATDIVYRDLLGELPVTSAHPVPGELWPQDVGWIVGSTDALLHVPRTGHYLMGISALGRAHNGTALALDQLESALPLGVGIVPLASVALLGCGGPLLMGRAEWIRRVTATLLALALLAPLLASTLALPPWPRYHIATALLIPVFATAGVAAGLQLVPQLRRANPWGWLLAPVLVLALMEREGSALAHSARQQQATELAALEAPSLEPYRNLVALRDELGPGDRLVSLCIDPAGTRLSTPPH